VVIEVPTTAWAPREKILRRAAEQGMRVDDAMSDLAVWELIFAPGFSTATEVSDVSGRGVGMDVVRRIVRELGGQVEISSRAGQGTRTVVRLPPSASGRHGLAIGTIYIALSAIVNPCAPAARPKISPGLRVPNLRGSR
jgi:two-component system chemotaxis sensor kinase CheA